MADKVSRVPLVLTSKRGAIVMILATIIQDKNLSSCEWPAYGNDRFNFRHGQRFPSMSSLLGRSGVRELFVSTEL